MYVSMSEMSVLANGLESWLLSGCWSTSVQGAVGAGSAESVSTGDPAVLRLPGC